MKITQNELLDALAAASPQSPADALTAHELADKTGVGYIRTKAALKQFAAEGRLQVHRVMRQRLDGIITPVPGYTILPAKKR